MNTIPNIAVFASGNGSNFRCIHRGILDGSIHGTIGLLVSNKRECGAVGYAIEYRINYLIIKSNSPTYENDLMLALTGYSPDLIVLAGYLKMIPESVIRLFQNRIINIHPALLPAFGGKGMYGSHVHRAVLATKQKVSGATVHIVDEKYDHGPILAQKTVQVFSIDTVDSLAKRVLEVEHILYPQVVKAFCEQCFTGDDGIPKIIFDNPFQEPHDEN